MKKLLIVALAVMATACSTTKLTEDSSPEAIKYTQDFGKVEVTYTENTWTEIKSTGTAAVPINDDAGLEQAMNIATMRAKRNIVEFMNTDLKSGKTVDTITDSLAKEVSEDDNKTKQKAATIATKVSEKIAVDANGILKGVYIADRKVSSDGKVVVVVMKVDKRSMNAAKQLRAAMSQ
jgi:transcriptional regulator